MRSSTSLKVLPSLVQSHAFLDCLLLPAQLEALPIFATEDAGDAIVSDRDAMCLKAGLLLPSDATLQPLVQRADAALYAAKAAGRGQLAVA